MKLNKVWHLAHRMPKHAALDERIAWHLEHKKNCGCRDIPVKLKEEIRKKGIKVSVPGNITSFNLINRGNLIACVPGTGR